MRTAFEVAWQHTFKKHRATQTHTTTYSCTHKNHTRKHKYKTTQRTTKATTTSPFSSHFHPRTHSLTHVSVKTNRGEELRHLLHVASLGVDGGHQRVGERIHLHLRSKENRFFKQKLKTSMWWSIKSAEKNSSNIMIAFYEPVCRAMS